MKYFVRILILFNLIFVASCGSLPRQSNTILADREANPNVVALRKRLLEIAKEGIAFGQQDATAYGLDWYLQDQPEVLTSDVKKVVNKQPALLGFDLGHMELGNTYNLDTVPFALMKQHTQKIYEKGGLITFSWHLNNPVSGGSSWDTTSAVTEILKDGPVNQKYEDWVKKISMFFKSLKDEEGKQIPVIFRPLHEMNGAWFWWGKGRCTPEEYKKLWIKTQELLLANDVHNLLYAYSPNIMSSSEDFEMFYPGDDYVDILGVDIYNHSGDPEFMKAVSSNLKILKEKSSGKNMPFALSETGNFSMAANPEWWTEVLYSTIQNSGISWVMVWRNARKDHYFSTYPSEVTENDFMQFEQKEDILFLPELKSIHN
ncbi:glycoside hydrolase family 26 protein [Zunongwangia endophytica]|uniref:Mannan endo-1,4-beta-mannosidase n=1 Tax=Zunongwangia endophytica TaxID=1808945 RepID=A0ABV8H8U9_9FLAO|nr:glycosyl hydrolase [Zunongwangia endophytica]MDN3595119.1 glycosyl hydrolase [Zunongwangia endophytica]